MVRTAEGTALQRYGVGILARGRACEIRRAAVIKRRIIRKGTVRYGEGNGTLR